MPKEPTPHSKKLTELVAGMRQSLDQLDAARAKIDADGVTPETEQQLRLLHQSLTQAVVEAGPVVAAVVSAPADNDFVAKYLEKQAQAAAEAAKRSPLAPKESA